MTPKQLAQLDSNLKKIRDGASTVREALPGDDEQAKAIHGRLGIIIRETNICVATIALRLKEARENAAPPEEKTDEPANTEPAAETPPKGVSKAKAASTDA